MTAATEQFTDFAQRGQEAVTTALRAWADTVQSVAGSFGTVPAPGYADFKATVGTSVDTAFDLAEKVLASQRQFAHTVLTAGAQAAEVVGEQATKTARSVTDQAVHAAEVVVEKTAEAGTAAPKADGATRPTARAAKN